MSSPRKPTGGANYVIPASAKAKRMSDKQLVVVCSNCGGETVRLTAKTTKNKGRRFYKCEEKNEKCSKFFVWEDELKPNKRYSPYHSGGGRPLPQCGKCGERGHTSRSKACPQNREV
jgi:hypothetical protein